MIKKISVRIFIINTINIMTDTCDICVEKYNNSYRLQVTCGYCEYTACRRCCETWLTNETTPRCINTTCGKEWTRQFISRNLSKSFVTKKYKSHRENILFDQERALLPATQPIVERMIQSEHINARILEIQTRIGELYVDAGRLRLQQTQLLRNTETTRERRLFIKACPDENCRGFLSSQWKCGLCEKWACSKCHELKGAHNDEAHTCNPNNVATAELLALDTKSCPTCGTGIHKLEGCDQMFCTLCHTAFSWRTGHVQTQIHNPHYYEWMRRTGGNVERDPNEVICGREINHLFTRRIVSNMTANGYSRSVIDGVSMLCQRLVHIRYQDLPRFHVDHVLNNQDLRVLYLRNLINEADLKTKLQRGEKKNEKKREAYNVVTMVSNAVTDILYRFDDRVSSLGLYTNMSSEEKTGLQDILNEVNAIVDYANECFLEMSVTYNSKKLYISPGLKMG